MNYGETAGFQPGRKEIAIIPSAFLTRMPLPRETESLKASSFAPDRQYALSER